MFTEVEFTTVSDPALLVNISDGACVRATLVLGPGCDGGNSGASGAFNDDFVALDIFSTIREPEVIFRINASLRALGASRVGAVVPG